MSEIEIDISEKSGISELSMEKSGSVVLTRDDLQKFRQGLVSDRVASTWGFSLSELSEVIQSKHYKEI